MNLPEVFTRRMSELLGSEYGAFIESFDKPSHHGLRVNRLKTDADALQALLPFELQAVPWCSEGFRYPAEARPSKHWAYHAGLFYIQEPSAMSPAEILAVKPGNKVLDLCAAPGGKSTQLAGQLEGEGLLIANDASASRCGGLVKNLELAGVTNAIVLNETPARLSERFENFFDAILVDAPCSGEGMFRRDADAVKGWAENKPEACTRMQREILHYASLMLKPGGRMVYSTCTFEPEEDEYILDEFLAAHTDFDLLSINQAALGISPGLCLAGVSGAALENTARIWPHRAEGEGHFAALLMKKPNLSGLTETEVSEAPTRIHAALTGRNRHKKGKSSSSARTSFLTRQERKIFDAFQYEYLTERLGGDITLHERSLFSTPNGLPSLDHLRVMRGGWYWGDMEKDRFTPSHALAMALKKNNARYTVTLPPEKIQSYLKGESFAIDFLWLTQEKPTNAKVWVLVCADEYPLGWGRLTDLFLKNNLPRGWALR